MPSGKGNTMYFSVTFKDISEFRGIGTYISSTEILKTEIIDFDDIEGALMYKSTTTNDSPENEIFSSFTPVIVSGANYVVAKETRYSKVPCEVLISKIITVYYTPERKIKITMMP